MRILPKPSEKSKPPMEIKAMFKSLSELRAIRSRMTLKNETQTVNALVGLSDNLRAENNNDENSKSIKKYNKELIDAIAMIVKYYTGHSLVKEEDNG